MGKIHFLPLDTVENLNLIEIIMERDEERKRKEARIFQVVRHSAYIHRMPTSLLYYLFDIFG